LKTRDQTHVLNAASPDVFKEYMRRNYRSWVRFGQDNYHSVDYDNLVIVTGVDLTSSCSMLAYAKNSTEMNASFSLDAAVFGSASLSAWKDRKHPERSWLSSGSDDYLASLARPDSSPFLTTVVSGAPLPRQCVFLRGWRSRLRRAPTRLEGGAGPDDPELPPGPEGPDTPCVSDQEVSTCADATSADEEVDIVAISDSPMVRSGEAGDADSAHSNGSFLIHCSRCLIMCLRCVYLVKAGPRCPCAAMTYSSLLLEH
jgi:hypothetical protein